MPAFCVPNVPEAQGGLPPGPHVQYVLGTRTSLGRWVRTAYCGTPGFGKGNASEYVDKMRDTQLCLQIAGLSSECYRLYEALDAGCVPIVVDNLAAQNQATASEQYRFLLHGGGALPGDGSAAPFPHAATPGQLAELLAQLRGNGRLLDELQAKTDRWWLRTLGRIIARVISVAESDPCAKLGTRLRRQAQVDNKARWS